MLRQRHNTSRARGPGVTTLSYWSDNQAGYSWWTVGNDQQVWGEPEAIYLTLAARYKAHGVPVRGWEPDNNFVVQYQPVKNWKGVDLKAWNTTLYPSGGEGFVGRLGSALGVARPNMVYYTNGFTTTTVHQNGTWRMVKANGGLEPHPSVAYDFYADLWAHAARVYAMAVLFTDFLCYRGPAMGAYQDGLPDGEEGEHLWLSGMTRGASDAGAEVQWCMATAHQVMASLGLPGVTNVRVNGDGGLDVAGMTLPALLAAALGLGWSKDNLRTADRCYVDGLYPNGTVKWPCGSINHGEGTSGQFRMQYQQTVLAALSLGPVGISDQLSARPTNTSAEMTTNVSLVMITCGASGDLLQPSYPLTPTERSIAKQLGSPNAALWATYTALALGASEASGDTTAIWYTALGLCVRRCGGLAIELLEVDLAVMVDAASPPPTSFSAVPRGIFAGAGDSFGTGSFVWWRADILRQQAAPACRAVDYGAWRGSLNMTLSNGDAVEMINLAPLLLTASGTAIALLGELGKAAAVSTHRFTSVSVGERALGVVVRGQAGETVPLLFVVQKASQLACVEKTLTIGADGTAATSVDDDASPSADASSPPPVDVQPNTDGCIELQTGPSSRGQGAGRSGRNVKYLGRAASLEECTKAAVAARFEPNATSAGQDRRRCASACWFRAPRNASFHRQCYCRVDVLWMPRSEPSVDSARLLWPCRDAADCSFNGQCDAGRCACKPAWKGPRCEQLHLLAVDQSALGYRATDRVGRNVSSWGAAVLWDARSGQWHGWASELLENCGINSWETNSQIVHVVGDTPTGPFRREEVVWPAFAHEPAVVRAPNGSLVMLYAAYPLNATERAHVLCSGCAHGTTPPPGTPSCPFQRGKPSKLSHKFRQMLATADSPWGPWRAIELPQLTTAWDWNTALAIRPDDSAIALIRGGMAWHAERYWNASSWHPVGGVDGKEGPHMDVPGGLEDPYLWIDASGVVHMLAHAFRPFFGLHAFSAPRDWPADWRSGQPMNWTVTGSAYGGEVHWTSGGTFTFARRERPHLVWAEEQHGATAVALTNGVQYMGALDQPNADATLTLAQPLSQSSDHGEQ